VPGRGAERASLAGKVGVKMRTFLTLPEQLHNVWARRLADRISEPLHLNLLALLVAPFGSYTTKVALDLVPRRHYAYGMLHAAEQAKRNGLSCITVIEFGVSFGGGILNLCEIARRLTSVTGVNFEIFGFDTGVGLPTAPRLS
jgi:hypothetical protein